MAKTRVSKKNISIVPRPLKMDTIAGEYDFLEVQAVYYLGDAKATADYLTEVLEPAMGRRFARRRVSKVKAGLCLELIDSNKWDLGSEGYELLVDASGIRISAKCETGLFYGVQTLRQLLPVEIFAFQKIGKQWKVPFVEIRDEPRFVWRGMHLDVARHFMPKAFVKKFIDLLALHKMNTLHWHLTEDQGWRIEIKKYPLLTEVGAWRDETVIGHAGHYNEKKIPFAYDGLPHGGYYTQEDIREIVAYAARRHINVMPEIELPGHSQAALTAYPEFSLDGKKPGLMKEWGISHHIFSPEEKTIAFLKDVFDEVLELFPSKYIHVGGDEAKKTLWARSARVKKLRDDRGLRNMHEMQSWFIKQFDDYLVSKGRVLIGWDEILEGGLAEGATVMSWQGDKGAIAAVKAGHEVVMAHNGFLYFDHYQKRSDTEPLAIGGCISLEKVYGYEPVPAGLTKSQAKRIRGAQAQLWTEYSPCGSDVEYMAYPRACALSEVVWLPSDEKNFEDFEGRLEEHLKRLSLLNVNFRRPYLDEIVPPRVDW